jgi:hypothetical protein
MADAVSPRGNAELRAPAAIFFNMPRKEMP